MNTDLLTFFSDKRSRGVIRIYDIGVPGNPDVQVLVYSPAEVNLSSGTAKGTLSDEEYKEFLKEIRSSLAPKGGMIAQINSHNGVVQVAVTPVKALGYTPPRKVLRLGPAALPKFEEIPQRPADLPVGDHLMVPVSTEAETRLQVFYEVLDGFPPDLALTVLNVIRRPSLEWRIERLEKQARQAPATWVGEQRSRVRRKTFLEKLGGWSLRRLPVGALSGALAVTFLLATGAVAGYHWMFGAASETEEDSATTDRGGPVAAAATPAGASPEKPDPAGQSSTGSGGNKPEVPPEAEGDASAALKELFQALASSENAAIRTLYKKHLTSPRGQRPGWGMAKLEALRLGIVDPGNDIFSDPQEWTAVKDLYRSRSGQKALENKKESSALLAWSSCTFFGKPELPATQLDAAPLVFGTERDCRKLDSNDIRSGLDDLTNWVKAQTK